MSNIDKRALAMTKELATLMVERFSMNPVSSKLLNEAWKKEFPDEVAIAERMLELLNELERKEEQRANWFQMAQKLGSDLEAAEKRIAELEGAEKKTVEMPTFGGYVPHVARELQAAFRIACDNAGINITAAGKGE